MCICFVYVADDDCEDSNFYQLILINNRDEFYHRPTKVAAFWNGGCCISGLDQELNKENGTWLGINTSGKIGILLNILESTSDSSKKGRGYLVTDYISGQHGLVDYAAKIAQEKKQYNKFNLVLLQKKNDKWDIAIVSTEDENSVRNLPKGLLAFGNSPYEKPWKKVVDGRIKFEEIVQKYNKRNSRDVLVKECLKLLSDKKSHWPDDQLLSQSLPTRTMAASYEGQSTALTSAINMSSNFVHIPEKSYGTRTHSIILIDKQGHGEYIEVNMKEPMKGGLDNEWEESIIPFHLS